MEQVGEAYRMWLYGVLEVLDHLGVDFRVAFVDEMVEEAFEDAYREGYTDALVDVEEDDRCQEP